MNERKAHIKNITKLVAKICKQKNRLSPLTAVSFTENLFNIRPNIVDLGNLHELNIIRKSFIRKGTETVTYKAPFLWQVVSKEANLYSKWIQYKNKKAGKKKLPMSSMSGFTASSGRVTLSSACFFKLVNIICKKIPQRM